MTILRSHLLLLLLLTAPSCFAVQRDTSNQDSVAGKTIKDSESPTDKTSKNSYERPKPSKWSGLPEEIVKGVVEHALAIYLISLLSTIGTLVLVVGRKFAPIRRYKKALSEQIKLMPFIYGDLQSDVLSDFVEIEIYTLEGRVGIRKSSQQGLLRDRERLRRSRRIIFLGDAGMGKTTFQRFAILSLLNPARNDSFVYRRESVIPVYVPLKLVDNSAPFPIIRFITGANQLFGSLRRFSKYANNKRLFLFLDGYDEVAADSGTNHLKDELTKLFGPPTFRKPIYGNAAPAEIGDALAHALRSCRIWVSSRREFFEQNAIPMDSAQTAGAATIAALEVGGVGQNRIQLVKNIFDKYRRREPEIYKPLLSEEYFISEIDRTPEADIRDLSFNPLFLTVMCYLYVSKVAKERRHDIQWVSQGLEDLIVACVRLLVVDLDKDKARDLLPAHREGLLRRRNDYAEEKEAFLKYFAAKLLFDGTGAFTLDSLRAAVRSFFSAEHWSSGNEILSQMDAPKSSRPDFSLQLLYAGLFILVASVGGQRYYDFPHRRFRELLALRYVTTPPRYCSALLSIDLVHVQEFLRLLRNSNLVHQRDFQISVLQHILYAADSSADADADTDITMSRNFFRMLPTGTSVTIEVKTWLKNIAGDAAPRFELAREVVKASSGDQELVQLFAKTLDESISRDQPERFGLSVRFLELESPLLLGEALRRHFGRTIEATSIRARAAQAALTTGTDLVRSWISESEKNAMVANDFLYALAFAISRDDSDEAQWKNTWGLLPSSLQVPALGFIARFAPKSFGRFCGALGLSIQVEWFDVIANMAVSELEELVRTKALVHIASQGALNAIDQKIEELQMTYVRSKSRQSVFNREKLSSDEVEINHDVPTKDLKGLLVGVRSELCQHTGRRIDNWPKLLGNLEGGCAEWLNKLPSQKGDRTLSASRKEIKPIELRHWLVSKIDAQVSVQARRLKELRGGRVAWQYVPPHVPNFFN